MPKRTAPRNGPGSNGRSSCCSTLTRNSTKHSAPILTAIAFIIWWEGRGSKAHQFLELALDAEPAYRLARLTDQMIGSGMVAGWNMDKDGAYRPWGLEAS
ncbi:DUF4192 family protein [Arthrobacter sp. ISL-5]|uniref:DUF4192 family protein n=1 Tax=Arthrobacter sp. ISL-5 TaxID=2819111 RepID=UPI0020352948|nr:DUF4192 family protein [Arthrobacter sp. ISL-5]